MRTEADAPRRIEQALAAYLAFREGGEGRDEFLARHADLRDLLEGLLADPEPPFAAATADAAIVFGDFQLLREVGRGGMGVVYEARQLSLDRCVALKVLPPHLTLRASTVARFRHEATILGGLEHRNIVRVLAVGQEGDTHWFAMEFVDGTSLDRLLRDRGVAGTGDPAWMRRAVGIAAQIADALEHAHKAGIVHRDVKPANILLRPDGTAVLTDFGVARDDDVPSVTLPGGVAGTPFYMSPEQVAGDRTLVDHRTDLFSLGASLFEMLTAHRPFEGATTQDVLHGIRTRQAPDPRRFQARLPRDLAAVVLRALAKEPPHRYATARDFGDDLRNWLEVLPVKARPDSPLQHFARWTRREPWKAAVLAMLVLVALGATGLVGFFVAREPVVQAGREKLLQDKLELGVMLQGGSHRDHQAARAAFEAVLALDPDQEEAIGGLALVIERWEGGRQQALAFLARHGERLATSRGLRRLQAYLLIAERRPGEAAAIEAELGPPSGAFELMCAARCESIRGDRGDGMASIRALDLCSLATRVAPRPRISFYLALVPGLVVSGSPATRVEIAHVLEELWPESSRAWSAIGDLLLDVDVQRAIDAYRRGLAIYPDEHGLLLNLVIALRRAGLVAEALDVARRLRSLHPAAEHDAWCGACLVAAGHRDEGLELLAQAASSSPDAAVVHACRGDALLQAGLPTEARASFERALALDASDIDAACALSQLLLDAGELTAARERLDAAVAVAPFHAHAHELRLRCLRALGDGSGERAEQQRWQELPRR